MFHLFIEFSQKKGSNQCPLHFSVSKVLMPFGPNYLFNQFCSVLGFARLFWMSLEKVLKLVYITAIWFKKMFTQTGMCDVLRLYVGIEKLTMVISNTAKIYLLSITQYKRSIKLLVLRSFPLFFLQTVNYLFIGKYHNVLKSVLRLLEFVCSLKDSPSAWQIIHQPN